jgi:hypothetical protein
MQAEPLMRHLAALLTSSVLTNTKGTGPLLAQCARFIFNVFNKNFLNNF